jgi:hypothetical protein
MKLVLLLPPTDDFYYYYYYYILNGTDVVVIGAYDQLHAFGSTDLHLWHRTSSFGGVLVIVCVTRQVSCGVSTTQY